MLGTSRGNGDGNGDGDGDGNGNGNGNEDGNGKRGYNHPRCFSARAPTGSRGGAWGCRRSASSPCPRACCFSFSPSALATGCRPAPDKGAIETLLPGDSTGAFGNSSVGLEGGNQELEAPASPEPFSERPDILAQAAAKDRTLSLDEDALTYLLQKIRVEADDFYRAEPALSHDRKDEVWAELLAEPDKYRGELVEVKGNIVSRDRGLLPLNLRGLEIPNRSGLDRAFESYLLGVDDKFFLVATLRKQRELEHLDGVRLRGLFLSALHGATSSFPTVPRVKAPSPSSSVRITSCWNARRSVSLLPWFR